MVDQLAATPSTVRLWLSWPVITNPALRVETITRGEIPPILVTTLGDNLVMCSLELLLCLGAAGRLVPTPTAASRQDDPYCGAGAGTALHLGIASVR